MSIINFEQFNILEATFDQHSFLEMMKGPSKLFFDDLRDQLFGKVDKIITESKTQTLINLSSYYAIFEYKEKIFKMQFTNSGLTTYCYYIETLPSEENGHTAYKPYEIERLYGPDGGTFVDIGSRSESINILFNKIDKFIKKLNVKI